MAANKHILVMEVLQIMVEGQAMHLKDIEKALGRIQWATAACPLAKSMLQPLWAWKMATTTVQDAGVHVEEESSSTPPTCRSPHGGVGATDDGLAFVGGQEGGVLVP